MISALGRRMSPLLRRGDVISKEEREEVRRGGGGFGATFVEVEVVMVSAEGGGMEMDDRFEDARWRAGGRGGDFRLGVRLRFVDVLSSVP